MKPKPQPFSWRGMTFTPAPAEPDLWRSEQVSLTAMRTADWKAHRLGSGTWYARLRVGSDRFPGKGKTAEAALDSAAAEARLVLRFIQVMLRRTRAAAPAPRGPRKAVAR